MCKADSFSSFWSVETDQRVCDKLSNDKVRPTTLLLRA